MLRETYAFISEHSRNIERDATAIWVHEREARRNLQFDLAAFPEQLLVELQHVEGLGKVIDLKTSSSRDWRALLACWDDDFYGPPFFRTLSFAATLIPDHREDLWHQAKLAVEPVIDRLRAIAAALDPDQIGRGFVLNMREEGAPLTVSPHHPEQHMVRPGAVEAWGQVATPGGGSLKSEAATWASGLHAAADWWRTRRKRSSDHQQVFRRHAKVTWDAISPEGYVSLLWMTRRNMQSGLTR